jgi:hypothetical protein
MGLAKPLAARAHNSGITGLSGYSGQQFRRMGNLDYDENAIVTISLRLVSFNNEPRPLKAVYNSRVPPPVGA